MRDLVEANQAGCLPGEQNLMALGIDTNQQESG
jgi:hypothetical protein